MRILEIATNFRPGGIQRHVLDLSGYLVAKGHEVTLAGDAGDWTDLARRIGYHPVGLIAVAGTGGATWRRLAALPRAALAIRQIARRQKIELVHVHETAPLLAAWLGLRGMGIPIVFTFHGSAPEREGEVARMATRMADLTVSPSQTSLDALIAHGLPKARARQMGLGIAPFPSIEPDTVAALRTTLLGQRGKHLVLSLSRLQYQKGIDVMLDVAARIKAVRDDVVIAIAGGGPDQDKVQGWAATKGVGDMVRFLGPIRTVPQHLAAADMFLLTSRWENLPISIVEAFRAGLPVVATDCGGVKELVDDKVGALAKVEDAAGIAAEVLRLVADEDLRRKKASAALARSAESRFDPDAVHAGFEDMYRAVLAQRG